MRDVGKGIVNTGNICYAASAVQMFLRTNALAQGLSEFVRKHKEVKVEVEVLGGSEQNSTQGACTINVSPLPVHIALDNLREKIIPPPGHLTNQRSRPNPYNAGVRLDELAALFADKFFNGKQHDPHEFFIALKNKLADEAVATLQAIGSYKAPIAGQSPLLHEQASRFVQGTWVDEAFTGVYVDNIECHNCIYKSVRMNPMQCWAVPITPDGPYPRFLTIQDLVSEEFSATPPAEGSCCENCKQQNTLTKRFRFLQCPNVLILQLVRCSATLTSDGSMRQKKRKDNVNVGDQRIQLLEYAHERVNAFPHVTSAQQEEGDQFRPRCRNTYQLSSFIEHQGEMVTSGHFITHFNQGQVGKEGAFPTIAENWYTADDCRIFQDMDTFKNEDSNFLLCYVKVASENIDTTVDDDENLDVIELAAEAEAAGRSIDESAVAAPPERTPIGVKRSHNEGEDVGPGDTRAAFAHKINAKLELVSQLFREFSRSTINHQIAGVRDAIAHCGAGEDCEKLLADCDELENDRIEKWNLEVQEKLDAVKTIVKKLNRCSELPMKRKKN